MQLKFHCALRGRIDEKEALHLKLQIHTCTFGTNVPEKRIISQAANILVMQLIDYIKHTLLQVNRFTLVSIGLFLGMKSSNAQTLSKRSFQHQQEESIRKIHFELQCNDSEQRMLLLKHIAQYSSWDRHRMLSSRRKIAIEPPYNATVELYSAKELNALYGKRIHAFYSDNPKDYYEVKLVVTQSGFKEIILSEPQK